MVIMPSTVVADNHWMAGYIDADIFNTEIFSAGTHDGIIQIINIGSMVLIMMYFHCAAIDMRLKGIGRIWKFRKLKGAARRSSRRFNSMLFYHFRKSVRFSF